MYESEGKSEVARVSDIRPTATQNLISRKKNLELELDRVNKALNLLENNPNIQAVLDSLSELNLRL